MDANTKSVTGLR